MRARHDATVPLLDARIDAVRYPGRPSPGLKDVRLRLCPREFVVLTGPAESGKSTLCRCLSGVIPLFESAGLTGEVLFRGRSITSFRLPELAGEIGLVSRETDDQLFCATVEEDLAFGPCSLLSKPHQVRTGIDRALDFVGLSGYEKRRTETLSGGEAQRAAIAAVLTLEPKLLILDRATDQLDPSAYEGLYERLDRLRLERGTTILTVDERALDSVPAIDRHLILDGGILIHDGPRKMVRRLWKGNSLGDLRSSLSSGGRPADNKKFGPKPTPEAEADCPAISVKELRFRYPGNDFILDRVSLKIDRGEFVALVGENGTGKTTLARHFIGLLRPEDGVVEVNGKDVRQFSPAQLSSQVGYLSQHPHLQVCTDSVKNEIGFSLRIKGVARHEINSKVNGLLEKFGLWDVAEVHPYRLTRSQLQRTALASCLVSDPPIVVLDEPTSGLCAPQDRQVMDLLKNLNEEGRTVVVISHDLLLVRDYCSRVIELKCGASILHAPLQGRTNETAVCR